MRSLTPIALLRPNKALVVALALFVGGALCPTVLPVGAAGARYSPTTDPLVQHGGKLTGGGEQGEGRFGVSVALSQDGDTALVGSPYDDDRRGAVWVLSRTSSRWTQQGGKLTGGEPGVEEDEEGCVEDAGEEPGECSFGRSVAISADGNTAVIGDPTGGARRGSAQVFTRTGSAWALQATLTGPNEAGEGRFGKSVALSADGDTALVGDPSAGLQHGTAWAFRRSGSSWGAPTEVVAGERSQRMHFGRSVALSADGGTALIGNPGENGYVGSAWVLTSTGSGWSQRGAALRGSGEAGAGHFGIAVALSRDGATALIGGPNDNGGLGALWAFTRQGSGFESNSEKLVGREADDDARFGSSVTLSDDGTTALVGAPRDHAGDGAVRVFTHNRGGWAEQAEQLAGAEQVGQGFSGTSVALSGDARVALLGAPHDDHRAGAAWSFVEEPPAAVPEVTGVSSQRRAARRGHEGDDQRRELHRSCRGELRVRAGAKLRGALGGRNRSGLARRRSGDR